MDTIKMYLTGGYIITFQIKSGTYPEAINSVSASLHDNRALTIGDVPYTVNPAQIIYMEKVNP